MFRFGTNWRDPVAAGFQACHDWSVATVQTAHALRTVVLSLERYHGAASQKRGPTGLAAIQLEAVRHNAEVTAQLHQRMLRFAPSVNVVWHQQQREHNLAKSPSKEAARSAYERYATGAFGAVAADAGLSPLELVELQPSGRFPFEALPAKAEFPAVLFGDSFYRTVRAVSDPLLGLVVEDAIDDN
jgi:hypothetical protein